MNIAHMMGSLNRGGAETLVLSICNNAYKVGLNLTLFHRHDGQLSDDFRNSPVVFLKQSPVSFFDIPYFKILRRLISDNNVQLIHTHQVIDALCARLACIGKSIPVVLTLHGHGVNDSRISRILRYLAILCSHRVVFVSEFQRAHYVNKYGSIPHAWVIPNGIDFNTMPILASSDFRETLGIPSNVLLLGSVGNFTSGRDQLTICRFLFLLAGHKIPFRFVFVGARSLKEPDLYDQCVAYCEANGFSEYVHFLGSRSDVPIILQELDAFIYSTVHDTFGMAVVEAMAAGLPVFVNDWEVMKEITNFGEWATLYQSRDEHDLFLRFSDFYTRQNWYKSKAEVIANHVKAKYSIDRHIQELKALYSHLLH